MNIPLVVPLLPYSKMMLQTFFPPGARAQHDITVDTSRSSLAKLVHILAGIYIRAIRTEPQVITFESVELRTWFSSIAAELRAGILKGAHGVGHPKPMETQQDLSTSFSRTLKIPPFGTFLSSDTKHRKAMWYESDPQVGTTPTWPSHSSQKPTGISHTDAGSPSHATTRLLRSHRSHAEACFHGCIQYCS